MRVSSVDGDGPLDLKGHTLVVPGCGSLAHLGELCVDALVSTFELKRKAIVESRHLLPVAMSSAFELPGKQDNALNLTTAAEIYQGSAPNLSVLQLRSAVVEGRRGALAAELWAWACAQGVSELLIISSCSSHVRSDRDLASGTGLRFVCLGGEESACAKDFSSGPAVLPLTHGLSEEESKENEDPSVAAIFRFLRGGGLARPLLLRAAEEAAAKVTGAQEEASKDFTPPPRASGNCPSVLGLFGLTSDILDLQLTEQLALAACSCLAAKLKLQPAPRLRAPPSWIYEMEASAPAPERRLWT